MPKFKNKYRIPSCRIPSYDYSSNGSYFIIICCKNKWPFFRNILYNNVESINSQMPLNTLGIKCQDFWLQIPLHFPFIETDQFYITANSIIGVLHLNKENNTKWAPNIFGPQSKNLASCIRNFKASFKRYCNNQNYIFEWQERYFDRVIRSEVELNVIQNFIKNQKNHSFNYLQKNWAHGDILDLLKY